MNRYYQIHRLRMPAFLLLVGVNALLAQSGVLGWGQSWPLYIILAGVFSLTERLLLLAEPEIPWPGHTASAGPVAPAQPVQPATAPATTAIVPSNVFPPEGDK